jgi:homoserine O-succinyltransferase
MAETEQNAPDPAFGAAAPVLRVALVNAMGDAALAVTEQRFARLFRAAFPDRALDLRCTTLPAIPRGEMAAARIARHYVSLDELRATPHDAVIFSGAEPVTPDLRQEVFWPALASLFDWVLAARQPALFSCLASHAAVLHFAGVARQRLEQKRFGIFAENCVSAHRFTQGLPEDFAIAHSRWNELPEPALRDAGFHILSRGQAGVDAFAAPDAPFLFFQGHPEYEPAALDGEYRRDLRRFDSGAVPRAPLPPDMEGAQTSALEAGHIFSCQILRNFLADQQEATA